MSWRRFWQRGRRDEELARELDSYLAHEEDEKVNAGLSREEARSAALRKLGNLTSVREEVYRMNTLKFIDTVWQDVRYGLRQLRLNPGFTLTALASLALGIGANTAIFQLLNAVRLRNLPVKNPHELAEVKIEGGNRGWGVNPGWPNEATYPLWEQIRDHQQAFSGIFAWGTGESDFGEREQKRKVRSLWVSGAAFSTLGVAPYRGRLLMEADDRQACDKSAAVISDGFWQREFAGQGSAVGARLMIDGRPVTVLGVTPPEFYGLEVGRGFDIAMPACTRWTQRRDLFWLSVIGRLTPDWTLSRAEAHLKAASPGLFDAVAPTSYDTRSMETWHKFRLTAEPAGNGVSRLRESYEAFLWLLLGITGLVLLIACANLANLLLASSRTRDRCAIGHRSVAREADLPDAHGKPDDGGLGCGDRCSSGRCAEPRTIALLEHRVRVFPIGPEPGLERTRVHGVGGNSDYDCVRPSSGCAFDTHRRCGSDEVGHARDHDWPWRSVPAAPVDHIAGLRFADSIGSGTALRTQLSKDDHVSSRFPPRRRLHRIPDD